MKRTLRAGLLTVCMTALATAPAVTVGLFLSADAAYANNGKGNGGGNSNAGGNGNGKGGASFAERGGGKDKIKGGKGHGNAHAKGGSSAKGGPKTLGELFQKLTGQEKKAQRTAQGNSAKGGGKKVVTASAPALTEAPAKRGGKERAGMHPSQLGNMNGALNANINAVLAHIRNGNLNGPVGLVAGLAIAYDGAGDARAVVELDKALSDADYTGIDDLDAYLDTLEDAANSVDPADYDTEEAYNQAVEDAVNAARDPDVEAALTALDFDGEGFPEGTPTLEEAEDSLIALDDARALIVAGWNKSDMASEAETDALIAALEDRVSSNADAIAQAIADAEARAANGEDDGEDDPLDDDLAECEDDICEGDLLLDTVASAD